MDFHRGGHQLGLHHLADEGDNQPAYGNPQGPGVLANEQLVHRHRRQHKHRPQHGEHVRHRGEEADKQWIGDTQHRHDHAGLAKGEKVQEQVGEDILPPCAAGVLHRGADVEGRRLREKAPAPGQELLHVPGEEKGCAHRHNHQGDNGGQGGEQPQGSAHAGDHQVHAVLQRLQDFLAVQLEEIQVELGEKFPGPVEEIRHRLREFRKAILGRPGEEGGDFPHGQHPQKGQPPAEDDQGQNGGRQRGRAVWELQPLLQEANHRLHRQGNEESRQKGQGVKEGFDPQEKQQGVPQEKQQQRGQALPAF